MKTEFNLIELCTLINCDMHEFIDGQTFLIGKRIFQVKLLDNGIYKVIEKE